jgi:hypothetical protein
MQALEHERAAQLEIRWHGPFGDGLPHALVVVARAHRRKLAVIAAQSYAMRLSWRRAWEAPEMSEVGWR